MRILLSLAILAILCAPTLALSPRLGQAAPGKPHVNHLPSALGPATLRQGGVTGEHLIDLRSVDPCDLVCPADATLEGEPPLEDGQYHDFNGGCSAFYPPNFQELTADADGNLLFCGISGWFFFEGSVFRDNDWLELTFGPGGVIEVTADAELPLYFFKFSTTDCATINYWDYIIVGPCAPDATTITGTPGDIVWVRAVPTEFESPDGTTPYEFDYQLSITGLASGTVVVEDQSWSEVKGMFD